MMKLYYSKGACSLAPHMILEELGLPYGVEAVNLGEPRSAEFLKVNPLGAVPALITDQGEALTEAAVILQYLGDLKPELNLLPKAGSQWERYRFQETLNFIATEMHKGMGSLFSVTRMVSDAKAQSELREFTKAKLATRFDLLSQKIEKHGFVAVDHFTVADAYLATILGWAGVTGVDLSKWPTIKAYAEKIRGRPAAQRALKAEGLL